MLRSHSVSAAAVETEKPTTQAAGRLMVMGTSSFLHLLSRLMTTAAIAVEAPVCIVTGGARGIGRAIAEMLGATGAKVKACNLQRD